MWAEMKVGNDSGRQRVVRLFALNKLTVFKIHMTKMLVGFFMRSIPFSIFHLTTDGLLDTFHH